MLFPGGTKEMLYLWLWALYSFLSVFTGGRVVWTKFLDTLLLCVNVTICLSGSGNLITVQKKKGYF